MKILITENQLEKVIDRYITKEIGYFKEKKIIQGGHNSFYINSKNKIIMDQRRNSASIWDDFLIHPLIWNSTLEVFNLDYYVLRTHFNKWIMNHLKITKEIITNKASQTTTGWWRSIEKDLI